MKISPSVLMRRSGLIHGLEATFTQVRPPRKFVYLKFKPVPMGLQAMIKEAFEAVKDQMGPCGISCALCDLGNGTVAESAKCVKDYLQNYGVSQWAPLVPGGSEVDFDRLFKSLDWVSSSIGCLGCEKGGGPPDCTIRSCAKERGYDICSECLDLSGCGKFEWLGESAGTLKDKLEGSNGKSKRELVDEAVADIE